MNIPIVFEDEDILVIDKPVGVSVAYEQGVDNFVSSKNSINKPPYEKEPTITDWVKKRFDVSVSNNNARGEFEQRFGIVHRLDKETSGVLMIAKNKHVFDYLKGLFKFRRIVKEYQALVYGNVRQDEFIIDAPILRHPKLGTAYCVSASGRKSITEFAVKKRFLGLYTYLLAYPKTGRTHQIRVHLGSLGHPIVNDYKYASKKYLTLSKDMPPRMMLHARSLTFEDWDGKKRVINSNYDLEEVFTKFG